MLNPFKMFNRLAWLALLLFGGGTAAMVTVVVLATGGLGSADLLASPGPTQPASVGAPPPPVNLNNVVQKRPLLENVPLPDQISTEPGVVTTNFGFAVLLALIFGIVSNTLSDLVREHENTFQRWLAIPPFGPLLRLLRKGSGQNVQRGCLTLPLIAAVFALYGIIFAFLEDGLSIFTPEGVQLAIVMAMSVGLISLSGDVAQRQLARLWRQTTRFGVYPANLLIAVATTVFSRVTHLSPGIAFGTPGGADVDLDHASRFRKVIVAFTTLLVMLALGAFGWLAAGAIRAAGDRTLSATQADFAGPLAQLGLTIGLALFFVAVETSFFEMVPLSSTLGSDIFRWNPVLWFAAFVPVMFVFAHTLLNPDSEYLQAFEQTNVQVLTTMIILLSAITAVLWLYFKLFEREPAAPYGGPYAPPGVRPPPAPYDSRPAAQRPITPQPRPSAPPEPPAYVPPPIIISDYVPPPIVIQDDPPAAPPDDRTQRRVDRRPPDEDEPTSRR